MALDFNKIEEPDDSVFPVKLEDESNLDMYGVWVKKRPENKESDILPIENDTAEDPFENDIPEFDDHDVVNLDTTDEGLDFEELTTLNNFETIETYESDDIIEDVSVTSEDDIYGDEFDIFDDSDTVVDEEVQDNFETDLAEMPIAEEEAVPDINEFETLDLEDFLSEDEAFETDNKTEDDSESESPEPDNNIKLDLSFDEDYLETKESDAIDFEGNDNFEITTDEPETNETLEKEKSSDIENLAERTIEDISDFDDILDELEANDKTEEETKEELKEDIPLNITIDEYSDITSLAGETMGSNDDLEDVEIFSDISEFEEAEDIADSDKKEKTEDDGLVIESTIIEAGNIDEIRKENQKIMANSSPAETAETTKEVEIIDDFDSMLDSVMGEETEEKSDMFFDDIEAFENDLLDSDNNDVPEEFIEPSQAIQEDKKAEEVKPAEEKSNVLANDKATEILIQIASELVNIKNELANMKIEMAQTQQKLEESHISEPKENTVTDNILNDVTESDKTGFFNDDDGDETIALTGDELNNILITADFTEENTEKEYEIPETLDEINDTFFDDEPEDKNQAEEDKDEDDEVFADEDLLSAVQPEHINDLTDDISFLDEDLDLRIEEAESEEKTDTPFDTDDTSFDTVDTIEEKSDNEEKEDILQIEDFISDVIADEPVLEEEILDTSEEQSSDEEEGNTIEDFDLKITELELPDGQSIPLGDEYSDFEAITDNIEEGHDEASDFADLKFDENLEQEETLTSDELQTDEIVWEDNSASAAAEEESNLSQYDNVSEIMMDNHADSVFSAEELDQAAQDIPRLDLDESAAEEQKIQTETLPIHLKDEIKSVLTYMDQLLESLPEEKIEEFAKSEYFDTYKRLFDELGIS